MLNITIDSYDERLFEVLKGKLLETVTIEDNNEVTLKFQDDTYAYFLEEVFENDLPKAIPIQLTNLNEEKFIGQLVKSVSYRSKRLKIIFENYEGYVLWK